MARLKYYDDTTGQWLYADSPAYIADGGSVQPPFRLPVASQTQLGGVKVSANIPNDHNWFPICIDGNSKLYTITQAAEKDTLGCIRADSITVDDTQPVHIDNNGRLFTKPATATIKYRKIGSVTLTEKNQTKPLPASIKPGDVMHIKIDCPGGIAGSTYILCGLPEEIVTTIIDNFGSWQLVRITPNIVDKTVFANTLSSDFQFTSVILTFFTYS